MAVRAVRSASFWFLISVCIACGDDDAAPVADAGSADSGKDAGPTMIPRRDAQVAVDPIPQCDPNPNVPSTCASGEVCDLVVRRAPGATQYQAYNGCVLAGRERAEGDPCDPDPTNGAPYRADGLLDEVFRDSCGPGLVCSPAREIRDGYTCQKACAVDLGVSRYACKSPSAICLQGTRISEFCRESDRCDVTKQTGCQAGEVCYLWPSDDGTQLFTVCSTPPEMPDPNGSATCAYLSCQPGSVCLGPVHQPYVNWTRADVKCRPICSFTGGSDTDAGDDDGGVGRGTCSGSAKCEAYSESGLGMTYVPKPVYGQCEP